MKMRTLVFALLVLILTSNTFGIPVYYHYCGGELESVDAFMKTNSCCGDEEEDENDCCQNEVKIYSQSYESLFSNAKLNIQNPVLDIFHNLIEIATPDIYSFFTTSSYFTKNYAPPPYGVSLLHHISILII